MTRTSIIALALWIALINCAPSQRPVIGIYTQDTQQPYNVTKNSTYIASSYVKNLQMAGAQVVPIFYHYSINQLQDILSKVNGVFFPGGQMPIDRDNQWTSKVKYIMDYATYQNDQGNVYPVWATCLGYETVMYLYGNQKDNMTILTQVYGQDGLTCPLKIITGVSDILQSLPSNVLEKATSNDGLYYFHHTWAVLASTYYQNPGINSFWKLVTTSFTKDKVQFVSTVQARRYPYYMTQYHPQKNSFQWKIPAVRSYEAIEAQQKVINMFVKWARLNGNSFSDEQLSKKIIYNYKTILTDLDYGFTEMYVFDQTKI